MFCVRWNAGVDRGMNMFAMNDNQTVEEREEKMDLFQANSKDVDVH